jgi:hypothetical protein
MTEPLPPTDEFVDGDSDAPEGMPRWVKVFAAVGIAFLVLLVVLLATGGHGPGRHALVLTAGAAHAHR